MGIGLTNQVKYDPTTKVKFHEPTPAIITATATDTTQLATMKTTEYYKRRLPNPYYVSLDGQYAVFWSRGKVGLDITTKVNPIDRPDRYTATLGVFFPLTSGETVVNLMPQVRWEADELKDRSWDDVTWGFALSAAIPGWLTKKQK